MNENQRKETIKWFLDQGNRPLTTWEKECFKQAIERANSYQDLIAIAMTVRSIEAQRR